MADDTRERILNAAGPIFARAGFEAATIRDICGAAGVNLASVNYHFGSKETLYLETVRLAHEQKALNVPLPAMAANSMREEKLHGFIRTILTRLLGAGDGGWQTELLIREMIRPTHACKLLVEDYIRPQFHRLLDIVDEFVTPDMTEADRHRLAFSIVGQCLHYRVAGGFVSLLVKRNAKGAMLDLDELANHITQFSIAALTNWSNGSQKTRRHRQSSRRDRRRAVGTTIRAAADRTEQQKAMP